MYDARALDCRACTILSRESREGASVAATRRGREDELCYRHLAFGEGGIGEKTFITFGIKARRKLSKVSHGQDKRDERRINWRLHAAASRWSKDRKETFQVAPTRGTGHHGVGASHAQGESGPRRRASHAL